MAQHSGISGLTLRIVLTLHPYFFWCLTFFLFLILYYKKVFFLSLFSLEAKVWLLASVGGGFLFPLSFHS